MKYLEKKFNTPGNSRAFVEGWERCFGEEVDAVKPDEEVPIPVSEEPTKVDE